MGQELVVSRNSAGPAIKATILRYSLWGQALCLGQEREADGQSGRVRLSISAARIRSGQFSRSPRGDAILNEDFDELQRRLERITSRDFPAEDGMDAESAELRAAWLAFGELLRATRAGREAFSRPIIAPPRPRKRSGRLLAKIAALAACTLIVVGVAWRQRTTRPTSTTSPAPAAAVAAHVRKAPSTTTLPSASAAGSSAETELKWDDSLDGEIASAGRVVAQVEQDQLASAGTAKDIQRQIEIIQKGMEKSPFE